jgi:hypothetical protein
MKVMKKNCISIFYSLFLVTIFSCDQEIQDLAPVEVADPCADASAGTANFTKFIALGNSLTAGFQAGALFNEGQANSLPKILAKQFACAGGSATFNQPDVNSVNGCYNYPACTLGRLILYDPDGTGPVTASPTPSNPTLPAPFNTAGPWSAFTGDKASLNNFGVPGVKLIEAVGVANYGTLNPYYGRFASDPSNKTLLVDAAEKGGTFFLLWLGANDVLKYATSGAIYNSSGTGANDMTPVANFSAAYPAALTAMLGASAKGVVGNIPNVTSIPFFTVIGWNRVTLAATDAAALQSQLATGYNGFLNAMVGASVITAAERDLRLLSFAAGNNGVLITDETLTDLTAAMVANGYSALVPYAQARQTKNSDLVCLTAASYLGLPIDITGDATPDGINGVSLPLRNTTSDATKALKGDDLILLSTEISVISGRITEFNSIIANAVTAANASTVRVALANVNSTLATLSAVGTLPSGGNLLQPNFAPPFGVFSEDGVHPNSKGYAYTANTFINAINTAFGAKIPLVDISQYRGTTYPVSPL